MTTMAAPAADHQRKARISRTHERDAMDEAAHPLLDELAAIVSAGGKRLRPRFCYWGFRAAGGGDEREIIRTGAALELLHTFAMIFDDVMDASPLRRKRLAAHH